LAAVNHLTRPLVKHYSRSRCGIQGLDRLMDRDAMGSLAPIRRQTGSFEADQQSERRWKYRIANVGTLGRKRYDRQIGRQFL
jgi:hypothetical protein